MMDIIFGAGLASAVFILFLFIWTGLLDKEIKPFLLHRFFYPKLPFKFPYRYALAKWERAEFHTKNQCREITIKGKVATWFGILEVGVKENGLWGYTIFLLKGVGTKEGFVLEPDTDLIRLLNEGKDFSRIFKEHEIELHMESDLGTKMKELETKINNLKVIERITDEADRNS
ncbi:MAG: hypothetical protein V3U54_07745 [Thermodesulfobacteriota bacterium]